MKCIHKLPKNERYIKKQKLKIMRDNIVDYNVVHTMTSRIMNSMQ